MQITNVSPLGDLDVPLLGVILPAGATVDVTAEQAAALLPQTGSYAPADDDAKRVALGTPDVGTPDAEKVDTATPATVEGTEIA